MCERTYQKQTIDVEINQLHHQSHVAIHYEDINQQRTQSQREAYVVWHWDENLAGEVENIIDC